MPAPHPQRRPRAGVTPVVILGVCLLAGCARPTPPSSRAGTLRLGAQNTPEASDVLSEVLFAEPLITIDWHGRPAARLATDWQWLDEGRSLELQLRQGVRFHDGTPLTSQIVATILRDAAKKGQSGSFEYVTGIEAVDEHRVVIRMSRADAFLVEAVAGTLIVQAEKPDIGTGPFKILSRTPIISAVRNDGYYRGTPAIDRVEFITYDTERLAWVAMMRGELDGVQEVNREVVEFLEGSAQFDTYSAIRPFYIPLVFNLHHPILKHPEVRRALVEAIDRDEIVRKAMRNRGRIADDPVWPSHWAYNTTVQKRSFDPAAARARLDAAGFPVRPAVEPGRMPSRFQINCLFFKKDFQFERIALLLQKQLAAVDVDLVLQEADAKQIVRQATVGHFDSFLYQLTSGKSFDWTYRFWHSGVLQDTGYTGVDEILDELRKARTDAEIRVAVAELRERFFEDAPAAFLAWPETTRAVDSRFDVGDRTDPEILANLWRWQPGQAPRRPTQ